MNPSRYGPFPYSPITDRPVFAWPNGAQIAVWVIPNLEFFGLDDPMPGDSNERIARNVAKIPFIYSWASRDYGNRVAVWRMMDVMDRYGIRGTAATNSDICDFHPQIMEAGMKRNWEFMGHGKTNAVRLNEMPAEEEKSTIKHVFDRIEKETGTRPKGWLSSGLAETWNTLDYLIDAGCEYVADWVNDDQPYVMNPGSRTIHSIPYSWEINDANQFFPMRRTSEEFEAMTKRQFDVLYREGKDSPRVMAIALHPFIMGVPHRIDALDGIFKYIAGHKDVWFATGTEIIEAYKAGTGGKG